MEINEVAIECPICHKHLVITSWLERYQDFNKFRCSSCGRVIELQSLKVINTDLPLKLYQVRQLKRLIYENENGDDVGLNCQGCGHWMTNKDWMKKWMHDTTFGCPKCGMVSFDLGYVFQQTFGVDLANSLTVFGQLLRNGAEMYKAERKRCQGYADSLREAESKLTASQIARSKIEVELTKKRKQWSVVKDMLKRAGMNFGVLATWLIAMQNDKTFRGAVLGFSSKNGIVHYITNKAKSLSQASTKDKVIMCPDCGWVGTEFDLISDSHYIYDHKLDVDDEVYCDAVCPGCNYWFDDENDYITIPDKNVPMEDGDDHNSGVDCG